MTECQRTLRAFRKRTGRFAVADFADAFAGQVRALLVDLSPEMQVFALAYVARMPFKQVGERLGFSARQVQRFNRRLAEFLAPRIAARVPAETAEPVPRFLEVARMLVDRGRLADADDIAERAVREGARGRHLVELLCLQSVAAARLGAFERADAALERARMAALLDGDRAACARELDAAEATLAYWRSDLPGAARAAGRVLPRLQTVEADPLVTRALARDALALATYQGEGGSATLALATLNRAELALQARGLGEAPEVASICIMRALLRAHLQQPAGEAFHDIEIARAVVRSSDRARDLIWIQLAQAALREIAGHAHRGVPYARAALTMARGLLFEDELLRILLGASRIFGAAGLLDEAIGFLDEARPLAARYPMFAAMLPALDGRLLFMRGSYAAAIAACDAAIERPPATPMANFPGIPYLVRGMAKARRKAGDAREDLVRAAELLARGGESHHLALAFEELHRLTGERRPYERARELRSLASLDDASLRSG